MTDLIIYGGTALTMNAKYEVIPDAVLRVKDGNLESILSDARFEPSRAQATRLLDARGCLVMPGLVNGHTHAGMTLLRGIADDLPLAQWLGDRIFPLERKWGNEKFVFLGTQLAALEMIRSGTTTFNDMYYFEEEAARAVSKAGLRAVCGQTVVEISGVEAHGPDLLTKFDEYLDEIKGYPLVTPAITPHSIYGVTRETWEKIIDYAEKKKITIHTHLAETQQEEDECLQRYGVTPTEFFDELGLWKLDRVIAAHGTCLTDKEIEILGKNGAAVVHNPESNLKLRTRICPVARLRAAGVHVALGTDGTASNNNLDLFQEADTAAKLQTFLAGEGRLPARDVVRMLTIEGASALGLDSRVGSLEPGKAADVIAVDILKPHATPLYDPYSHLIYSASGADVKHTVVAGKVLMEGYRVESLDETEILAQAREWGARIAAG